MLSSSGHIYSLEPNNAYHIPAYIAALAISATPTFFNPLTANYLCFSHLKAITPDLRFRLKPFQASEVNKYWEWAILIISEFSKR